MKVLLVHRLIPQGDKVTFGAVEYHRMYKPHDVLGIESVVIDTVAGVEDSFLSGFNICLFSRSIPEPQETVKRLNDLGLKVGLDLDDYWQLDTFHALYPIYQELGEEQKVIESIKAANFVICTNEQLYFEIKPINDNVHIIENGIDETDPVWQPNKTPSKRIRFGFTQGTTHEKDIESVAQSVSKSLYDRNFYHKCQVVLCGFNAEHQQPSIYIGYEKLLTDSLKPLKFDPQYCHELKTLYKTKETDKPYRRIWNLPIDEYPKVYDEFDICVSPLLDTKFNNCKSNLKMLEAGFKGCAAMVSGVKPYLPLATKDNCFLLSEKTFFEWQRYILQNPGIVIYKQEALKEAVKPYSLQKLGIKRQQIYESL